MLSTGFAAAISRLQNAAPPAKEAQGSSAPRAVMRKAARLAELICMRPRSTESPRPIHCPASDKAACKVGGVSLTLVVLSRSAQGSRLLSVLATASNVATGAAGAQRTARAPKSAVERGAAPAAPGTPHAAQAAPAAKRRARRCSNCLTIMCFPATAARPQGAAACIDHIECHYVNNRCENCLK